MNRILFHLGLPEIRDLAVLQTYDEIHQHLAGLVIGCLCNRRFACGNLRLFGGCVFHRRKVAIFHILGVTFPAFFQRMMCSQSRRLEDGGKLFRGKWRLNLQEWGGCFKRYLFHKEWVIMAYKNAYDQVSVVQSSI